MSTHISVRRFLDRRSWLPSSGSDDYTKLRTDGRSLWFYRQHTHDETDGEELIAWWVDDQVFCMVGDNSNIATLNYVWEEIITPRGEHKRGFHALTRGINDHNGPDTLYVNGKARGYDEVINLHEVCK